MPTHHDDEPGKDPAIWLSVAVLLTSLMTACAVFARSPSDETFSAGLRAGTLGTGTVIEYHPSGATFGLRAGIDGIALGVGDMFPRQVTVAQDLYKINSRLSYDSKVRLLTGHVTVDAYPLKSAPGLRISIGIIGNANRLEADLRSQGTLQVGPSILPAGSSVQGRATATWNPIGPYLGVGYSTDLGGGFHLTTEVGAFYQGHPHTTASVSGPAASLPIVQTVMQEERRRITKKVDYPFYPVLEIGVAYRF
jgi:hypothetical protein